MMGAVGRATLWVMRYGKPRRLLDVKLVISPYLPNMHKPPAVAVD